MNPLEKQKNDFSFNYYTLEFKDLEIESKYIEKNQQDIANRKKQISLFILIVNFQDFYFSLLFFFLSFVLFFLLCFSELLLEQEMMKKLTQNCYSFI